MSSSTTQKGSISISSFSTFGKLNIDTSYIYQLRPFLIVSLWFICILIPPRLTDSRFLKPHSTHISEGMASASCATSSGELNISFHSLKTFLLSIYYSSVGSKERKLKNYCIFQLVSQEGEVPLTTGWGFNNSHLS